MISFKNTSLANYLMFKLDKLENEFSVEELDQIEDIVLDSLVDGERFNVDFGELKHFRNLKSILIFNTFVKNDDILILLSFEFLNSVSFEKCFFEDVRLLSRFEVKELSLVDCDIYNYDFVYTMSTLEKLSIVNGEVSLANINQLSNLNYLQLSYCDFVDVVDLDLPCLIELYIDNTNVSDLSFVNKLENLKIISLSEGQYLNDKMTVDTLYKKKVLILNEGISDFNRGEVND